MVLVVRVGGCGVLRCLGQFGNKCGILRSVHRNCGELR